MKPTGVAILCATAYVAFRIMLFMANMQHQVLTEAPFLPLFVLVFISIVYVVLTYHKKTSVYNWTDAFKTGGKVALLSGLLASAGVFIYYKWIDVDFLEVLTVDMYNKRKAEGFNEAELKNYLEVMQAINSPLTRSTLLLSGTVAWGLISSLIMAFLAKMLPGKQISGNQTKKSG